MAKTEEQNKELCKRFFEEVWNKGNTEAVDEFVADDMKTNNPDVSYHRDGPEGVKSLVKALRGAMPDLHYTIHEIIAEGDLVAVRLTSTGSHTGEAFHEIKSSGMKGEVEGISFARIRDGKIVETWAQWNFPRPLDSLAAV